jgi:hypothetical protein
MDNSSKRVRSIEIQSSIIVRCCCGWPLPESHSGFLLWFAFQSEGNKSWQRRIEAIAREGFTGGLLSTRMG